MSKEELLNKMEYLTFTNLLKVKNEIMYQQSMIKHEKGTLKQWPKDSIGVCLSETISRRQKNIDGLLDNLFPKDSTLNTAQKISLLDYRINRDFPRVIKDLISGRYHYDWNIEDCEFDYDMVKKEPQIKDIYRNQFELENLEESEEYDKGYPFSDVLNPIYFDIMRSSLLDSQYLPFLVEIIQHQLYDPNHLDCVPSNEPFYGCIDKRGIPNLTSSVLLDSRTNFNLLVNGSDLLRCRISSIGAEYQKTGELDSKFFLISDILREKEVSIIDSTRFRGSLGVLRGDFYEAYISTLVSSFGNCDVEEVQDLLTYLASDEGIQKQVMISKYPSVHRDDEIDTYCDFIEKRRGPDVEGISKLKMLKLY